MSLELHNLRPRVRKNRKRVGRGNASGRGTYAGRGQKGQRSRTGGRKGLRRRGLKQFLQQLPKLRGFRSLQDKAEIVNLGQLGRLFPANSVVTPRLLKARGLISSHHFVRILGGGTLEKPLTVQAHSFSESAKKAIVAAGGQVKVMAVGK